MDAKHPNPLKSFLVPIHREGWPFIAICAVFALGLAFLSTATGVFGAVVTLWCVYFFRDPPRVTPLRDGLVISPADGLIVAVAPAEPPAELGVGEPGFTRVSIFMSIFDVHINRAPIAGTVIRTAYRPGKFFPASTDKASDDNERLSLLIEAEPGFRLVVVQIAGLVARRIKCWVGEGSPVRAGQRFGMIRFGSRVDVYLPETIAPLVVPGQRSIAGETVLADRYGTEDERHGEPS